MLEMIERRGFAVPFPIEVRTVAADDAFLSTAAGRDSGFVAVHMFEGMAWEPYFRAVEAIMDELGGRPHWGKRHFQTAADAARALPRLGPLPGGARAAGPRGPLRQRVDRPRARTPCGRRRWLSSAHARLERATAGLQAPFALVDLDAMWANAADMERRAGGKPIRLASKSLRCRALQQRVLARPGFRGTLAFTLPEALWLAGHGVEDIARRLPERRQRRAAPRSAGGPRRVTVMVDSRRAARR